METLGIITRIVLIVYFVGLGAIILVQSIKYSKKRKKSHSNEICPLKTHSSGKKSNKKGVKGKNEKKNIKNKR